MAFAEPNVGALFPVPLLTFQLDGAAALNARLIQEVATRRKTEASVGRSNRYGWHSAADLFDRAEPAHAEIARQIDAMVASATAKMIPDLPKGMGRKHEGWINVSPTNAMNAPHDHTGAFWSGCYYVHVPPSLGDDKLSGAIEFIDPRGAIGASATIDTLFTRPKFTVRPVAGTCLLWPCFLKHWVHPNRSAEERVSIAFNSWYGRAR